MKNAKWDETRLLCLRDLYCRQGKGIKETARLLGLPEKTVRNRLESSKWKQGVMPEGPVRVSFRDPEAAKRHNEAVKRWHIEKRVKAETLDAVAERVAAKLLASGKLPVAGVGEAPPPSPPKVERKKKEAQPGGSPVARNGGWADPFAVG